MNIYNNNKQLLSALGVEGNYSTDFEVRKAILTALGGDATECNTIYEVDTQILKIYEEGGGGSGSDVWDLTGKTNFGSMFSGCQNLTEAPKMITSDGTNFSSMFSGCNNLTTIPLIDTSNGADFRYMFYNCENLTSIPQLNTSNGTNFSYMFDGCNSLTTIPQLDTSNGTNFGNMFADCSSLITAPQLDTSNGTNFSYMLRRSSLITAPQLDTSNGTNFSYMFEGCTNLVTIPLLDISIATNIGGMFGSILNKCPNLTNVTFTGSINVSIDFQYSQLLTYDSVKSILTACSNTTNTTSKTLKFSRTLTDQNGELATLVSTCTSKGWTISGLTLN
jgi:hypothetical protein